MGQIKSTALRIDRSLVRYLLIGGVAFAADYSVFMALYALGAGVVVSTTLGFATGFIISFVSNRQWVHRGSGKQRHMRRQLIEYSVLVAFNYIVTVQFVRLLFKAGIAPGISKLLIMACIVVWNYLLFKHVIFKAQAEETGTSTDSKPVDEQ